MKAFAPGKLILTGEHAVVYGRPALVTAIDRFATCEITEADTTDIHLLLLDLNNDCTWPVQSVMERKTELDRRHEQFLRHELPIEKVLDDPADLFCYAIALALNENEFHAGLTLRVQSDVLMGCGMGSSAATVTAALAALQQFTMERLCPDELFQKALSAERLQHGRPSGVDPYTSVHGGLLRFQQGQAKPLGAVPSILRLVHTGKPVVSTGQCVATVARNLGPTDPLWDEFGQVSGAMARALEDNDAAALQDVIKHNHDLLCRIGVVPDKVQDFISSIEEAGGAAKICGAGATDGDSAGIVWVHGEDDPLAICREFGYTMVDVKGELNGVRIA